MKPHSMLFDEQYSEEIYQSRSVREHTAMCDGLIVIGTALETALANMMVRTCVDKQ